MELYDSVYININTHTHSNIYSLNITSHTHKYRHTLNSHKHTHTNNYSHTNTITYKHTPSNNPSHQLILNHNTKTNYNTKMNTLGLILNDLLQVNNCNNKKKVSLYFNLYTFKFYIFSK